MKWKAWCYKGIFYHILANDGSALASMCGRDEKLWLSIVTCWKIAMAYTC